MQTRMNLGNSEFPEVPEEYILRSNDTINPALLNQQQSQLPDLNTQPTSTQQRWAHIYGPTIYAQPTSTQQGRPSIYALPSSTQANRPSTYTQLTYAQPQTPQQQFDPRVTAVYTIVNPIANEQRDLGTAITTIDKMASLIAKDLTVKPTVNIMRYQSRLLLKLLELNRQCFNNVYKLKIPEPQLRAIVSAFIEYPADGCRRQVAQLRNLSNTARAKGLDELGDAIDRDLERFFKRWGDSSGVRTDMNMEVIEEDEDEE